jgi:hypothetical protein
VTRIGSSALSFTPSRTTKMSFPSLTICNLGFFIACPILALVPLFAFRHQHLDALSWGRGGEIPIAPIDKPGKSEFGCYGPSSRQSPSWTICNCSSVALMEALRWHEDQKWQTEPNPRLEPALGVRRCPQRLLGLSGRHKKHSL